MSISTATAVLYGGYGPGARHRRRQRQQRARAHEFRKSIQLPVDITPLAPGKGPQHRSRPRDPWQRFPQYEARGSHYHALAGGNPSPEGRRAGRYSNNCTHTTWYSVFDSSAGRHIPHAGRVSRSFDEQDWGLMGKVSGDEEQNRVGTLSGYCAGWSIALRSSSGVLRDWRQGGRGVRVNEARRRPASCISWKFDDDEVDGRWTLYTGVRICV